MAARLGRMRRLFALVFVASAGGALFGQATTAPQTFEVASVKASGGSMPRPQEIHSEVGPATLTGRYLSLLDCIRLAYEGQYFQISGGPNWEQTARFMIDAKASGPVSKSQLMAMFRALLADRFGLKLHFESRETLVYALVAGKRSKLVESKPDESAGWSAKDGVAFTHMSMQAFAQFLSATTPIFLLDLPVMDQTGLSGFFDFTLKHSLAEFPSDAANPLVFSALEEVGLNLVKQKLPATILVVDHAEKPSEN